jgi:hypothetical protein
MVGTDQRLLFLELGRLELLVPDEEDRVPSALE